MRRYDIAIAGAGLGGAILARALNRQGRRVILIERNRHPRFAIGESSTPLAALSLERLARDYGLEDLHQLANYSRWSRHHKQLGRGLKRGFTFYDHRTGDPRKRAHSALLVAASPNDAVADAHWLRQDVDHYLVRQACREGVEYHDRCQVTELTTSDSAIDLVLDTETSQVTVRASVLVDATGKSGLVAKLLGLPAGPELQTHSSLLYGHFHDLPPLLSEAAESTRHPYPEQWAAVHHILREGWAVRAAFR